VPAQINTKVERRIVCLYMKSSRERGFIARYHLQARREFQKYHGSAVAIRKKSVKSVAYD